jgi:hypothetical protein
LSTASSLPVRPAQLPGIYLNGRPQYVARRDRERPASFSQTIGFFLFVLVNATLFLRPSEIVPELEVLPTYEVLILACLFFSLPAVYKQVRLTTLPERPVTLLVLALMVAVVLSHLLSPYHYFFIWGARMSAYKFLKILVYYLLVVSLLDTPRKLRRFLGLLGVFILFVTLVALLHWHSLIHIPAVADAIVLKQLELDNEGEIWTVERLQSTGMFNDPNDLCLILVAGMTISVRGITQPRTAFRRLFWLTCLLAFGYALYLTRSRGGFIAMLAALLVLFHARFGLWKSIFLSVLVFPLIFLLFAGRSTELSTESGTGQDRLQLWSESLQFFREAPLFGIGEGEYQEYADEHHVVHNSFLQGYAELGFFGGTIFLGAFYYAFWILHRLGSRQIFIVDAELRRLRPFVLTLLGGYGAGLLSLSRVVIPSTYLILGVAAAYLQMVVSQPPLPKTRFSTRLVVRLALVSMAFLVLSYLFVRTNVRWG